MKLTMNLAAVVVCLVPLASAFHGSIDAESQLGKSLLSKARSLEQNNYQYYSWIGSYSIKFTGCVSVPRFEREEGMSSNLIARFSLCPSDGGCRSCRHGGEYAVDMREFIETFQEAQREANEYVCQSAQESCQYDCENGYYNPYNNNGQEGNNQNYNQNNQDGGGNGEYCQYACLSEQGYDYCAQDQGGEGQQDMNELSECRPMNEEEGQQNNNQYAYGNGQSYQVYYVGAYCTSSGVYAGVFTDSACTKHAPSGTYEKYNYGYSLPTSPLVSTDCLDCKVSYNNNGNNNNGGNNDNNNGGVMEVCTQLYEQSARCERNVKGTSYKDTSGCDLIHTILPRMNSAFKGMTGPPVAKIFAWLFGLGFFALGGYVYLLHKKVVKQKNELATLGYTEPSDGGVTA